jgi:hypothetical protein
MIVFFLGMIFVSNSKAQAVAINTTGTAADPSAMLDVVSNSKGILFPRMNKSQREGITAPATGLLVFQNAPDSIGFYYYSGTQWLWLTGQDDKNWTRVGNNIFNTNTGGNVGIGVIVPTRTLSVNGSANIDNADFNNGTVANTLTFGNNSGEGIGSRRTSGANQYGLDFYTASTNRFSITNGGNVGIGTTQPNALLQFDNSVQNRKLVLWELNNNDHQYYGFGINGGVLRYQTASLVDDHVFYAGASPTVSNEIMRIKGDGNVGIGTALPTANLQVNGSFRLVNGTQAANRVLRSDANGVGTWQNDNTIQAAVVGTISGVGVNVPYASMGVGAAGGALYTNSFIDLPPGKWIVFTNWLIQAVPIVNADNSIWLRTYIGDSNVSSGGTSDYLFGSGGLVSGIISAGDLYSMCSGQFLINNTTTATKRYYFWVAAQRSPGLISTIVVSSFGGFWGENQVFAVPMN